MTATDRKGFDPLLIVMALGWVVAVGAIVAIVLSAAFTRRRRLM